MSGCCIHSRKLGGGAPSQPSIDSNDSPASNQRRFCACHQAMSPNKESLPVRPCVYDSHWIRYVYGMLYVVGKSAPAKGAATGTMVSRCGGRLRAVAH